MTSPRTYDKDILFAEIKAIVKIKGGELLSTEYISAKTKLEMRCAEGHEFEINQSNLKNGKWCRICGRTRGALARIANKGDDYLIEICKGRTILCLDTTFRGVKAKHRFQCKNCKHEWDSTPDNISQGKGCPPCSKGVGLITEPKQKGRLVTIPAGHFKAGSAELKTHEYTEVQFTGPVRKHYERLGYSAPINTLFWIRTKHLPVTSNYTITLHCVLCGVEGKRPLSNAIKSRGCASCYGNQIGDALRFDESDIERQYGIKVVSYKNSVEPMEYLKKCGCTMSQALGVLRLTGVGYCVHDSEFTWRTFENFIRDEVSGVKGTKGKHGVTVDIITDKYLIEIKLNVEAVFSNYGRRSPMEAIELYQAWAKDNNRKLFVVVNESDTALIQKNLPAYYLGWESWKKVGLSEKAVDFGKKIAANPQDHRIRKLSKEDEDVVKSFKSLAKSLKRQPKVKELKESGISIARLAMASLGTNCGSLRDISKSLDIEFQPFSIAKEDRPRFIEIYLKESKKAGYLLGGECKVLVGVSINQIMDWVVGRESYSMERLQSALNTKLPLAKKVR